MKILVTGGSGFIGRALIVRLNESGHEVVATSRDPQTSLPGATLRHIAELGPETDWSKVLEDIEAVVHLAARVHVMDERADDPLSENRRINAAGTARLAAQAAAAGVRHFIFLSTIKVHGEASGVEPFRADDTPRPQDPYAMAKLEAEQALLEIATGCTMQASIIRPPLVYGPGVRGNFLAMLRLCAKGWPLPLASINNRRSLVYSGNLVDLVVHLLDRRQPSRGIYLVSDGQDVSTPELFARTSRALGARTWIFPVPQFLLTFAAALVGKAAVVSRLTESLVIDDGPTRNDLNWTPPFSMLQGLKQTADWFLSQR